jgi:hypothetical protein
METTVPNLIKKVLLPNARPVPPSNLIAKFGTQYYYFSHTSTNEPN